MSAGASGRPKETARLPRPIRSIRKEIERRQKGSCVVRRATFSSIASLNFFTMPHVAFGTHKTVGGHGFSGRSKDNFKILVFAQFKNLNG